MKRRFFVAFGAVLVAFFAGCALHRQTETDQRSFDAALYNRVKIETQNGEVVSARSSDETTISVHFTKWATGHTLQEAKLNIGKIDIKVKEDTTDSVLRITVKAPTNSILCGCDVELSLPESLYVELTTSNGKITAQGHQAGLRLKSSNGDIDVGKTGGKLNARTSNGRISVATHLGDLYCKTSNGEIELTRTVGDADLVTSNGQISVGGHSGNIKGETKNGKIDASVVMPVEDGICRFTTSNGAIRVAVKDSVSASITLKTSFGKINVDPDFQFSNVDIRQRQFKGKLGEGSGTIRLTTSNGKVSLEKL